MSGIHLVRVLGQRFDRVPHARVGRRAVIMGHVDFVADAPHQQSGIVLVLIDGTLMLCDLLGREARIAVIEALTRLPDPQSERHQQAEIMGLVESLACDGFAPSAQRVSAAGRHARHELLIASPTHEEWIAVDQQAALGDLDELRFVSEQMRCRPVEASQPRAAAIILRRHGLAVAAATAECDEHAQTSQARTRGNAANHRRPR
jgi:hypothetical protein